MPRVKSFDWSQPSTAGLEAVTTGLNRFSDDSPRKQWLEHSSRDTNDSYRAVCHLYFFAGLFTARAYARAVLGVVILYVCPSVRPSVCLSVTRVDCNKTKWCTIYGVCTLPLSALKGDSKSDFFSLFECKSTAYRLRRCQLSSPVSAINIWWSAAKLISSTVEICI